MKNKYSRCLNCSWVRLLTLQTRSHRQWTSGLCLHSFIHTEHPSEHRNEFWRAEDYFHVPLIAAHLTQPFWEGEGLTFLSKVKRFRLCFWLFPFQAETCQCSCWRNSCDNAYFTAQLVGNHKFSEQVSVTFTLSHVLVSNRKNIHTYIHIWKNKWYNKCFDQCLISLGDFRWLARCHKCWRKKTWKLLRPVGLSSLIHILCLHLSVSPQFILLQWPQQNDLSHLWMSGCAVICS